MSPADGARPLLAGLFSVLTEGIEPLDRALVDQGVAVRSVDWRPPVEGTEDDLARVAADPRRREADSAALGRMLAARPVVVDVVPAQDVLELPEATFLHAGPPLTWDAASGPMRGALVGAALYEGLAGTEDEAAGLFASGAVSLAPCHSFGAVGPMAGVVSPSMPVFVVHDERSGRRACCTLNEGLGRVLRYGALSPDVIDRLRWMATVLGPALGAALRAHGPLDLRAMTAQALQMGDEGHNRNRAATSLFLRSIAADLVASGVSSTDAAAVLRFVAGNDHFYLNLSMAAAKVVADSARDIPGSAVVVAMARNGTDFGIQTSGTGDLWFTAPAGIASGLFLPGYTEEDANPDIGDSAITETVGLGGFAMAAAPAIVQFVGGTVQDALRHTLEMYEITLGENEAQQIPALAFRGSPMAIDVTKVVRTGLLPVINTGIAGKVAGTGQVGAGVVRPPMSCFVQALRALTTCALPAPDDRSPAPAG